MSTNIIPEEVIFYLFKNIDNVTFKSMKLQSTFFKLKKDPNYSDLLDDFEFSGSPAAPYSEVLDNALFNLQLSEKLKRDNPDLIKYTTNSAYDYYYKEIEEKLNPATRQKFLSLAIDMEKLLHA